MDYIAMKTENEASMVMQSDLIDLQIAARKLANHVFEFGFDSVGGRLGFGTAFLRLLASFAAIYLLILDRTNWRTNMLTALLVPYAFLSFPTSLFSSLRGEVGKWIGLITVVLRLFYPRHFPDWLEMPGSLILLLVVAPDVFAHNVRDGAAGVLICLAIGCYLLQEHVRASGGFRNSLTERHGISNSLGIVLLLAYPVWRLILHFL